MGRKGRAKKLNYGRVRTKKDSEIQGDKTPAEWVINIKDCLKEGPDLDSGKSWSIYRVPKNMLHVYRSAYIPKTISIGPFHYGDPSLQAMEVHKLRFLYRVLGYTPGQVAINGPSTSTTISTVGHVEDASEIEVVVESSNLNLKQKDVCRDVKLENLESAMKALERKTRESYSQTFDMSSDDFVRMMVIDGCFVVEILRLYHRYFYEDEENVDEPIFTTRWMLRTFQRDLLMLQNQLPLFVLQELFNLTICSKDERSLIELTLKFFDPLIPRNEKSMLDLVNPQTEYEHLLDVVWTSFITPIKNKNPISRWKKPRQGTPSIRSVQERQLIHSASDLKEVGIKFLKKENNGLLDIDYSIGVLEIPPIYFDDNSVPVYLNFMAYEQSDLEAEPYFTNHFMFFDSLVNSAKDVKTLHNNGIINHALGSNEDVANLINKLCREIVYDIEDCHLLKQMKGVNDFYKDYYTTKWHLWWSNLIRDYFSSPWTFMSLLAAIVLLILTATQSFFAIYPYFVPRKSS